jgi:hypothetical protein
VAAGGALDQARRTTGDRDQLLAPMAVQPRDRPQQPPRVGVLRGAEDALARGVLDDPPGAHHRDLVGDRRNDAKIVGDDDDRGAKPLLKLGEQRQDLRLHGDVERGRGLIRDQQLRVVGERHRDHRPLAHATRELVRVLVYTPLGVGDPDQLEQLEGAIAAHRLGDVTVSTDRLHQLGAHLVEGVQRRQRVSPIVVRDETVLPDPDSPTMPSVLPVSTG